MKLIKLITTKKKESPNKLQGLIKIDMKNEKNKLQYANLLRREIIKKTVRITCKKETENK